MSLENRDLVSGCGAGNEAYALRRAINELTQAGSTQYGSVPDDIRVLGLTTAQARRLSAAETSALRPAEVRASLAKLRQHLNDLTSFRRQLAVRQAEQARHYSLAPYGALVREIDCAGSDAYLAYSLATGIRPDAIRQSLGFNLPIVLVLQHELRKRGIETRRRHWFSAGNTKQFLETTELPGGGTLYIDPAWQAALPEGSDYAAQPHVLIAPSDRIGEVLAAHGVPGAWQDSWHDAEISVWEPSSSADWLRWNPCLTKLFRDEPFHPPLETRTSSI